jgi:hypothetical protein
MVSGRLRTPNHPSFDRPDGDRHESWDLAPVVHKPRSGIYRLMPVGVDTADVERVGSLIARLAFAHCVTPRNFVEIHFGIHGYKHLYPAFAGIGRTASEIVARLETLTLQKDLARSTLLPLGEFVSGREMLRTNRAWCPQCYQQQRASGGAIYDKLLWAVAAVRVCTEHRVFLVDRCPSCAYVTASKDLLTHPGYCPACARWLGHSGEVHCAENSDEWTWELWKADAIGGLIQVAPSLPHTPTRAHLRTSLRQILDQLRIPAKHFAAAAAISQRYFSQCVEGKHRLALHRLLRVAWSARISPVDILVGRFRAGPMRDVPERQMMRYSRPQSRAGIELKWERVESAARAALERNEPPSIAQLTEELGLAAGYLTKVLDGDLRAELTRRYLEAKEARRRDQIEQSLSEASAIVSELVASGIAPTWIAVAARLKQRKAPLRTNSQFEVRCRDLCDAAQRKA